MGIVLDQLHKLPSLEKNTVIAFVGDHGWQLGDLGEFGKKTKYIRIPVILLLIPVIPYVILRW